jgi:tRNA threonylcarbamoyladenosine biosynthesis protein TsaB
MSGILAIETATDACSVALVVGDVVVQRHEVAPRQHSQLLFGLLTELLPLGGIVAAGVEAIAYGSGPGSFTGLRIAASAAQGLSFSASLPAIPVSTLAVMAQTALREGETSASDTVLCTLDARINEVYSAVYVYADGIATLREGPWALPPQEHKLEGHAPLRAIGNGCQFLTQFPEAVRDRIVSNGPDLLPQAQDLAVLARHAMRHGITQLATEISPVYVRDEISWKKLSEQGPGR